jgi:hypothetical protein
MVPQLAVPVADQAEALLVNITEELVEAQEVSELFGQVRADNGQIMHLKNCQNYSVLTQK